MQIKSERKCKGRKEMDTILTNAHTHQIQRATKSYSCGTLSGFLPYFSDKLPDNTNVRRSGENKTEAGQTEKKRKKKS